MALASDCAFPLAAGAARERLQSAARARFAEDFAHTPPTALALLALATDVALEPTLDPAYSKGFEHDHSAEAYRPRLDYLASARRADRPPTIAINGRRADLGDLSFKQNEFVAHRLEVPWLLRR